MTAAVDPPLVELVRFTRDGMRVGDDAPLRAGVAVWPDVPAAPRPLPTGWHAGRVGALRVGLPVGFDASEREDDESGSVASFYRPDLDPSSAPLVVVRSQLAAGQPFVAEANQLAARFTHQLQRSATQPLRPVQVPRAPRAVMGAWDWIKEGGIAARSTVALIDGEDGERYTVQLNGATEHLSDGLVAAFYATLSIGLLNDAW